MKNITLAALLAASFVSVSAHAAEAVINVTAKVDPILTITAPGGAALSKSLKLDYDTTTGKLKPAILPFQLNTNVEKTDFKFKLTDAAPSLKDGAKIIPLKVIVEGKEIGATDTVFTFAEVVSTFSLTATGAASKELKLQVATKDDKPVQAGSYAGEIKLQVTQQP